MDKLTFEILKIVKEHYQEIRPWAEYEVTADDKETSTRQFYTKDLSQNLFEAMSCEVEKQYRQGSGNELANKMRALRSSSAMTYNILGNSEVEIGSEIYTNQFEWQNKTLKSSSMPANLDALLVSKNGKAIACEMKMMEWIPASTSKIKGSYLIKENYKSDKAGKAFVGVIESLIKNKTSCGIDVTQEYPCCFKHYDAFQMIKHCIALYNACVDEKIKYKQLTLINCVWEFSLIDKLDEPFKTAYLKAEVNEHQGFEQLCKVIDPIKQLFKEIKVEFCIEYKSATKFISDIKMDSQHKAYLKRYTLE